MDLQSVRQLFGAGQIIRVGWSGTRVRTIGLIPRLDLIEPFGWMPVGHVFTIDDFQGDVG